MVTGKQINHSRVYVHVESMYMQLLARYQPVAFISSQYCSAHENCSGVQDLTNLMAHDTSQQDRRISRACLDLHATCNKSPVYFRLIVDYQLVRCQIVIFEYKHIEIQLRWLLVTIPWDSIESGALRSDRASGIGQVACTQAKSEPQALCQEISTVRGARRHRMHNTAAIATQPSIFV